MTARARPYLFAAAGFALGLSAAAFSRPTAAGPADRPPLVSTRGGHVAGDGPPRELRPLTLRVGDELTPLGDPRAERPAVATVYLEVSGVPVVASFEVGVGD